jgi:hypothetical protein
LPVLLLQPQVRALQLRASAVRAGGRGAWKLPAPGHLLKSRRWERRLLRRLCPALSRCRGLLVLLKLLLLLLQVGWRPPATRPAALDRLHTTHRCSTATQLCGLAHALHERHLLQVLPLLHVHRQVRYGAADCAADIAVPRVQVPQVRP